MALVIHQWPKKDLFFSKCSIPVKLLITLNHSVHVLFWREKTLSDFCMKLYERLLFSRDSWAPSHCSSLGIYSQMSDDTSRCISMSATQVSYSSAKASLHLLNVLRKALYPFFRSQCLYVESLMYWYVGFSDEQIWNNLIFLLFIVYTVHYTLHRKHIEKCYLLMIFTFSLNTHSLINSGMREKMNTRKKYMRKYVSKHEQDLLNTNQIFFNERFIVKKEKNVVMLYYSYVYMIKSKAKTFNLRYWGLFRHLSACWM